MNKTKHTALVRLGAAAVMTVMTASTALAAHGSPGPQAGAITTTAGSPWAAGFRMGRNITTRMKMVTCRPGGTRIWPTTADGII